MERAEAATECDGEACAAGKFGPGGLTEKAKASCAPCASGSSSTVGASECVLCSIGKYAAVAGEVACTLCKSGKYATDVGRSTCTGAGCQFGKFGNLGSATVTAATCNVCAAGTYGDGVGLSACKACGMGTFQASPAMSECTLCSSGQYSWNCQAMSECTNCQGTACVKGKFGPMGTGSAAAAWCAECGLGRFTAKPGQNECAPQRRNLKCAANEGVVPGTPGSDAGCSTCAAGMYAATTVSLCLTPATVAMEYFYPGGGSIGGLMLVFSEPVAGDSLGTMQLDRDILLWHQPLTGGDWTKYNITAGGVALSPQQGWGAPPSSPAQCDCIACGATTHSLSAGVCGAATPSSCSATQSGEGCYTTAPFEHCNCVTRVGSGDVTVKGMPPGYARLWTITESITGLPIVAGENFMVEHKELLTWDGHKVLGSGNVTLKLRDYIPPTLVEGTKGWFENNNSLKVSMSKPVGAHIDGGLLALDRGCFDVATPSTAVGAPGTSTAAVVSTTQCRTDGRRVDGSMCRVSPACVDHPDLVSLCSSGMCASYMRCHQEKEHPSTPFKSYMGSPCHAMPSHCAPCARYAACYTMRNFTAIVGQDTCPFNRAAEGSPCVSAACVGDPNSAACKSLTLQYCGRVREAYDVSKGVVVRRDFDVRIGASKGLGTAKLGNDSVAVHVGGGAIGTTFASQWEIRLDIQGNSDGSEAVEYRLLPRRMADIAGNTLAATGEWTTVGLLKDRVRPSYSVATTAMEHAQFWEYVTHASSDCAGNDIRKLEDSSFAQLETACNEEPTCAVFNYNVGEKYGYLKTKCSELTSRGDLSVYTKRTDPGKRMETNVIVTLLFTENVSVLEPTGVPAYPHDIEVGGRYVNITLRLRDEAPAGSRLEIALDPLRLKVQVLSALTWVVTFTTKGIPRGYEAADIHVSQANVVDNAGNPLLNGSHGIANAACYWVGKSVGTDTWCTENCHHDPPNCPADSCSCPASRPGNYSTSTGTALSSTFYPDKYDPTFAVTAEVGLDGVVKAAHVHFTEPMRLYSGDRSGALNSSAVSYPVNLKIGNYFVILAVDSDCAGNDIREVTDSSYAQVETACNDEPTCVAFNYRWANPLANMATRSGYLKTTCSPQLNGEFASNSGLNLYMKRTGHLDMKLRFTPSLSPTAGESMALTLGSNANATAMSATHWVVFPNIAGGPSRGTETLDIFVDSTGQEVADGVLRAVKAGPNGSSASNNWMPAVLAPVAMLRMLDRYVASFRATTVIPTADSGIVTAIHLYFTESMAVFNSTTAKWTGPGQGTPTPYPAILEMGKHVTMGIRRAAGAVASGPGSALKLSVGTNVVGHAVDATHWVVYPRLVGGKPHGNEELLVSVDASGTYVRDTGGLALSVDGPNGTTTGEGGAKAALWVGAMTDKYDPTFAVTAEVGSDGVVKAAHVYFTEPMRLYITPQIVETGECVDDDKRFKDELNWGGSGKCADFAYKCVDANDGKHIKNRCCATCKSYGARTGDFSCATAIKDGKICYSNDAGSTYVKEKREPTGLIHCDYGRRAVFTCSPILRCVRATQHICTRTNRGVPFPCFQLCNSPIQDFDGRRLWPHTRRGGSECQYLDSFDGHCRGHYLRVGHGQNCAARPDLHGSRTDGWLCSSYLGKFDRFGGVLLPECCFCR